MIEKTKQKWTGNQIDNDAGHIIGQIGMPTGEIPKIAAFNKVCIAYDKERPCQKKQIGKHQFCKTLFYQKKRKNQKNQQEAVAGNRCPLCCCIIATKVNIIKERAVYCSYKDLQSDNIPEGDAEPVTEHPVAWQCKGKRIQERK